jgi:hypothetical protein
MAAVYKWRKRTGAVGPVIINGTQLPSGKVFGYPSIQCLRAAELFLLEKAQKGLKTAKMRSLNVDTALEEDVNGITRKLVVIGSRGRNQIEGVYGQANLPVLAREHKLSQLYAQAAHDTGHEGVTSTLHRMRKKVWIIHGRALADSIKAKCTECRLKEKKCMEQKMGPLPDHRVQMEAMFQSVAIDLFGPVEYQQHVKKRQVGKGWGVVFVCTTTSVLHVEFMDTFYGQLPVDTQAVHEYQGHAHEVPVRQGRAAGGRRQASHHMGLQRGRTVGREEGHRVDAGAYGRPALQRASRKNDRINQAAAVEDFRGRMRRH